MVDMFREAFSFNQDVTGWDVCSVTDFSGMFTYSGQPDTDLSDKEGCSSRLFSGAESISAGIITVVTVGTLASTGIAYFA
ncbi:hypothetical protein TrRE_jg2274 [Triparma retinervis]|uniref:Uncharacterized protein n=1 Tax=Triparma retinervis TaxID=2557542 RepID=A0A9W7E273_9STRA|nr:hypothetical protein TrRE_jg2274 [Triparma retinervis]